MLTEDTVIGDVKHLFLDDVTSLACQEFCKPTEMCQSKEISGMTFILT